MASNSSNSTNDSPLPVALHTNAARFSQKLVTGKVIRLQAHVYVFICSHCDAEFRNPNGFLQHCEIHYLSMPPMPYFSPNLPSSSFPEQMSRSSNRVVSGFGNQNVTMPSLPSSSSTLPPFNSYASPSSYFQSRRWPQFNSMAYTNQSSIAPRQANNNPSWSDCCSPIGGAQAQCAQSVMQTGVIDYYNNNQQQMHSTEESDAVGMRMATDVTETPDHDDVYEIFDLGYDQSATVADLGESKKRKRSKSKMGGPFTCELCSKSYNRRTSLTRHYQSIHKQTSDESRPKSTA